MSAGTRLSKTDVIILSWHTHDAFVSSLVVDIVARLAALGNAQARIRGDAKKTKMNGKREVDPGSGLKGERERTERWKATSPPMEKPMRRTVRSSSASSNATTSAAICATVHSTVAVVAVL